MYGIFIYENALQIFKYNKCYLEMEQSNVLQGSVD